MDRKLKRTIQAIVNGQMASLFEFKNFQSAYYIDKLIQKYELKSDPKYIGYLEYIYEYTPYFHRLMDKWLYKRQGLMHPDFYQSAEWKKIRRGILKRDNNACKECGSTESLHVHHIKYREFSNKRKNLITLCKVCHKKKHDNWSLD